MGELVQIDDLKARKNSSIGSVDYYISKEETEDAIIVTARAPRNCNINVSFSEQIPGLNADKSGKMELTYGTTAVPKTNTYITQDILTERTGETTSTLVKKEGENMAKINDNSIGIIELAVFTLSSLLTGAFGGATLFSSRLEVPFASLLFAFLCGAITTTAFGIYTFKQEKTGYDM